MPTEMFLVPMVGDGIRGNPWRPKYTLDDLVSGGGGFGVPGGDMAITVLTAPQTYLDFIAAEPDSTRLATADNLESPLTAGQATAIHGILAPLFIPPGLIQVGDTRKLAIRRLIGYFLFSNMLYKRFGAGWKAKAEARGMTLNSRWSDFPQVLKNELLEIWNTRGWRTDGLTNTSTMLDIVLSASQQFDATDINIRGVRF